MESKQNYDYTTCSLLFTISSCLHFLSSPISSISFLIVLHVLAEEQIPEKRCNFGYNNYHTYQLQKAPLFDAAIISSYSFRHTPQCNEIPFLCAQYEVVQVRAAYGNAETPIFSLEQGLGDAHFSRVTQTFKIDTHINKLTFHFFAITQKIFERAAILCFTKYVLRL